MLDLLRSQPNFGRFWLGQAVSQVGDQVHDLTVLWLVYSWTGSGLAVGGVLIASTLPGVLVAPLAGQLADRISRRIILVASDLLRAGVALYLAWRAFSGGLGLWELMAATGILSLGGAFFNPAAMAWVPALVPEERLRQANAFGQLSTSACGVLGPLLGSSLVALIGPPSAFAVNGFSFLFSAALEASIRAGSVPAPTGQGFWAGLVEGWRSALSRPLVRRLMGPIIVVNFFFSGVVVLLPVLAEGVYKMGPRGLGYLMSAFAAGMLIGVTGLALDRSTNRRGWVVVAGLAGLGIGFVAAGAFLVFPLTLAALALAGLSVAAVNVTLITIYQVLVPDEDRGKVFGLVTALSLSLVPISYGVMGALAEFLDPRVILVASGAVILLSALELARVKELRAV